VGARLDHQLEQGRLVCPAAPRGRPHRPWIGAQAGQVVAADTTSINLYKALSAALSIARQQDGTRRVVVSERSNFPTDLYIAEALPRARLHAQADRAARGAAEPAARRGGADAHPGQLPHRRAARHGAHHRRRACRRGADGVGPVPQRRRGAGGLDCADADLAVGCTYKYFNGGPGSPAFVWVHPRHVARCWQPLAGWWGHAAPFDFTPEYQPAMDITRYQCGTQPIISLAALDAALDVFDAAAGLGGIAALRAKSLQLTDLFIERVEAQCPGQFELVTRASMPGAARRCACRRRPGCRRAVRMPSCRR
jgi:kynureninase